MASIREMMLATAPPWLQDEEGARLLFTLGTMLDGTFEWTRIGIQARFPSYLSAEVLTQIGRDRVLFRGAFESDETYADRLRGWLDAWLFAGNPFTILEQLRAYLSPHEFVMRIVNNGGSWYTLEADGSRTYQIANANWDWDAQSTYWSRFWVIMYPPTDLWDRLPDVGDPTLWGGAIGNPGYTIGSTALPQQVADVRSIVNTFKDAKSRHMHTIVCFDSLLFDPGDTMPPNPDGTWGNSSKVVAGTRSIARSQDAIYWPGAMNR